MSKWKFFNFRPLFFAFTILIVGILSANYVRSKLYLSIGILALTLLILLVYCLIYKKLNILLIGILIILVGVGDFYLEKNRVENNNINIAGSVICGTVGSVKKSYSGRILVVTDVEVNGESANTNCYVYLNVNEVLIEINAGDKITFVAEKAEAIDLYGGEVPASYYIKNNIKYAITTSEVITCGKDESLKLIMQQRIKENISLGLDNEKTNLMYSALFGDSTVLNPMIMDSFTASGVAHLIAVSGLNVTLIALLLMVVLKLFKCNKYLRFIITVVFLIFYCYMCGWSASIVRATLMAIVMFGAPLIFCEYDTLSSLSLSGIIILLIRPSDLFDTSFLLSFMCVFGIVLFYPHVNKLLNKIHFNNPISQTLLMSVITNLSTLFIMIYYFEKVSFIGIISNILIIPLFTFVFSVVFVVGFISSIAPFICYLLTMIAPIINIVIILSNYFASIAVDLVTVNVSFLSIILFAILLLFLSKFNVKGIVGKTLSTNVILMLLIAQIILNVKVIGL